MWARERCEIRPSAANAAADIHPTTATAKASFFIIASPSIAQLLNQKPENAASIPTTQVQNANHGNARTIRCTTNGRGPTVVEDENALRLPPKTVDAQNIRTVIQSNNHFAQLAKNSHLSQSVQSAILCRLPSILSLPFLSGYC
jgi:hypothetical protein